MHILVRLYLRTAFFFLALGLLGGLWVEVQLTAGGTISHGMVVAHVHLLLVGFLLMMIFGVAYWLFPRAGRSQPIGPYPNLVGFAYVLMAAGTMMRAATEFFDVQLDTPFWGYVRLGASASQVAGIAIAIWTLWERVRGAAHPKADTPQGPSA
jgi:hypothetical protein